MCLSFINCENEAINIDTCGKVCNINNRHMVKYSKTDGCICSEVDNNSKTTVEAKQ